MNCDVLFVVTIQYQMNQREDLKTLNASNTI